jgi:polyisoprenoid-binding protein YceI
MMSALVDAFKYDPPEIGDMSNAAGLAGNKLAMAAGLLLSVALAGCTSARKPTSTTDSSAQKDFALAEAGSYKLDHNHVAVIARVLHRTFSYSVFRFGVVEGTLEWNPAPISASRLTTTVQTGSIETNVEGFAKQLTDFLKSAKYPQATFVSTGFRRIDPAHAQVDGQFTLMGKTEPVTFDASLIDAGPGFTPGGIMGHVIGIHAETSINPHRFGLPDMLGDSIQIVVDTEFDKVP